MSTCQDDDKVRNPLTNKCVLIRGKVCQTLLKQKDPVVHFDKADMEKIRSAGYHVQQKAAAPPKTPSSLISKDDSVLVRIKKYISKFLQSNDLKNPGILYINNGHKKYCSSSSSKLDRLTAPLEQYTINYNVILDDFIVTKGSNFIPYLSKDRIPFETKMTTIFSLYFNNYNQTNALNLFYKNFEVPEEWVISTNQYLQSLSTYDKFTILGYSYHSFDYINTYLRGLMDEPKLKRLIQKHKTITKYIFPFFSQVYFLLPQAEIPKDQEKTKIVIRSETKTLLTWFNGLQKMNKSDAYNILLHIQEYFPYSFWVQVMDLFASDLKRIIDGSPPLTKTLTIYRGVKDDYFLKGSKDKFYKNNTFVSCSLNPYHSLTYVPKTCCLKRISILPGSRVLLMAGLSHYNEYEVVLNVDSIFYIHQKKKHSVYKKENEAVRDLCFNTSKYSKRKVELVDIIVS